MIQFLVDLWTVVTDPGAMHLDAGNPDDVAYGQLLMATIGGLLALVLVGCMALLVGLP